MRSILKSSLVSLMILALTACSTTSYVPSKATQNGPKIAVIPFSGPYGSQAADLITQELAVDGFGVVDSFKVNQIIRSGGIDPTAATDGLSQKVRRLLGADYLMIGTSSVGGSPGYSFPHVNLTAHLTDARTGEVLWVGRYGNAFWTSAISTQGDLQRGAHDLTKEFKKKYGDKLK